MKIVVCAPVAERGWILQEWIDHIRAQTVVADIRIAVVYSDSTDNTLEVLERNGVEILMRDTDTRPVEEINQHIWDPKRYFYMAQLRNCLIDRVRNIKQGEVLWEPDYVFSLDTDILIPPHAMSTLLYTMQRVGANAISPLVNLERRQGTPPAWNFMMWDEEGKADRRLFRRPIEYLPKVPFQADCLLAAIFMDRRAQRILWGPSDQGEDITWSRNAERRGLRRFVEPQIIAEHWMHPC